jgi:hypothetical protein
MWRLLHDVADVWPCRTLKQSSPEARPCRVAGRRTAYIRALLAAHTATAMRPSAYYAILAVGAFLKGVYEMARPAWRLTSSSAQVRWSGVTLFRDGIFHSHIRCRDGSAMPIAVDEPRVRE